MDVRASHYGPGRALATRHRQGIAAWQAQGKGHLAGLSHDSILLTPLPDALFNSHTLQGFNHRTQVAAITFLPMGLVAASTPVPAPCHEHLQNTVGDREWHQVALVPPATCTVAPGRISSQGVMGLCFFLWAESCHSYE